MNISKTKNGQSHFKINLKNPTNLFRISNKITTNNVDPTYVVPPNLIYSYNFPLRLKINTFIL